MKREPIIRPLKQDVHFYAGYIALKQKTKTERKMKPDTEQKMKRNEESPLVYDLERRAFDLGEQGRKQISDRLVLDK